MRFVRAYRYQAKQRLLHQAHPGFVVLVAARQVNQQALVLL